MSITSNYTFKGLLRSGFYTVRVSYISLDTNNRFMESWDPKYKYGVKQYDEIIVKLNENNPYYVEEYLTGIKIPIGWFVMEKDSYGNYLMEDSSHVVYNCKTQRNFHSTPFYHAVIIKRNIVRKERKVISDEIEFLDGDGINLLNLSEDMCAQSLKEYKDKIIGDTSIGSIDAYKELLIKRKDEAKSAFEQVVSENINDEKNNKITSDNYEHNYDKYYLYGENQNKKN